ncbi:MAG: excinuclease ABC subunit UvrC [Deltaproteobacteria bacterium]|nr:excinuclease ABC subunit UvrC [Deltaproteobacteria bacterium]
MTQEAEKESSESAKKQARRRESREGRQERIAQKVQMLPAEPGCYLMRDDAKRIFYIGKAQNLRARVKSYFSGSDTRQFVAWLDELLFDLDVIVVHSEKEALLLERTLIREHRPRFNVLLTDDKNFIHLRLQLKKAAAHEKKRARYPRLEVVRNPRDDGAKYFGPYHSASAVRQSLRLINRHFGLRTCTDSVLENRKRACLQFQIGRCPAPCVVEIEDYSERVQDAAIHLGGQGNTLEIRLQERMWNAAQNEAFETAARLRDQLEAVQASRAKQVVSDVQRRRNQDVFGVLRRGSLLEICRLEVREGRMVSSETFPFEDQEFPTSELVSSFIVQLYSRIAEDQPERLPDEILLGLELEEELDALGKHLSEKRGKRVKLFEPARGQLKRLVELAEKNATIALDERQRRDETRVEALEQLQTRMKMNRLPSVIECFDVSLFQGTDAVASQVCFVDGAPDKSRYRLYNIKTVDGTDDYMMLYEALSRRLKRGLEQDDLPDLLVVDGGKGQLNVAQAVCRDLSIPVGGSHLYLAGIAKARTLDEKGQPKRRSKQSKAQHSFEEEESEFESGSVPEDYAESEPDEVKRTAERLFVPGVKDPLIMRSHTKERYLLEQLRDEAHRFAITRHRKRRKKRTLRSSLDDIPGVGFKKRRALLQHLGSIKSVKEASLDELAAVPGIGEKLARIITKHLEPEQKDTKR